MTVESALADGSDLVGMSIDWSKCFAGSRRDKVHTLACCNRCAACTVRCAEGLSCVIQGCPLNVLLINLLMNTWARSVKTETTTAMPKVYADDAGVLSKNSCDIDIALKITGRFATVTQQKLNVDKTKVSMFVNKLKNFLEFSSYVRE